MKVKGGFIMRDQELVMTDSWKNASNIAEANLLIDMGVLLSQLEAKFFRKNFKLSDQEKVIRHLAVRFAERHADRLACEILIETLLHMLIKTEHGSLVSSFVEELLLHPDYLEGSIKFVETSLSMEIVLERSPLLFVLTVSVNCELGIMVHDIYEAYPDKIPGAEKILSCVSTYLLSVSNANDYAVRLALIHYFGTVESIDNKLGFNRIMSRFGFTVFEYIFNLLFNKKTEAIALQYLFDNIPFVMEGDRNCQHIIHQIMRANFFKYPERFVLFVKVMAQHISSLEGERFVLPKKIYLQHLAQLFKITSEVNHKRYAYEVMQGIFAIESSEYRPEIVNLIMKDSQIRGSMKELIEEVRLANLAGAATANSFRKSSRRGRKPRFSTIEELSSVQQVSALSGRKGLVKAS